MTVKTLIDALSAYPENADVKVINFDTREKSDITFITWKNSMERVNLYYTTKK